MSHKMPGPPIGPFASAYVDAASVSAIEDGSLASTQQEVASARAAFRTDAVSPEAATSEQALENAFEDAARACWAEDVLPHPKFWQRLSLSVALEGGP